MKLADEQKDQKSVLIPDGSPSEWKPMFTVTSDIHEVEPQWRALEAFGIQSPGQSFDFVRSWVEQCEIPLQRQFYVTAYCDREPFVVLPLMMTRRLGATVLTWFVGSHVACNGPLINTAIMSKLSEDERKEFWRTLVRALPPSDAVYMPGVPTGDEIEFEAFEGQSKKPVCDYVYRTEFDSWEEADKARRDRKRRRRDKQHRQKLDALGNVELKRFDKPEEIKDALNTVFEQKRARFEQLDIDDPFADEKVRNAYEKVFSKAELVRPVIYALCIDGAVVSARYCIAHGRRLFMLISSMSDDADVMAGSPGNQCLLEVLKAELNEDGFNLVDIGVGEADEKRRWCNVMQPVCTCFIPRTAVGWGFFMVQAGIERLKMIVKGNATLFAFYKAIRGILPPVLKT